MDAEVAREICRTEAAFWKGAQRPAGEVIGRLAECGLVFLSQTDEWIRLLNEFHHKIYPRYFPEVPQRLLWRTKRVRGHRWCGIARRIRKESVRTFRMWDEFKAGQRPMEIVRRQFPLRSAQLGRRSKKELMAVHRSLERASQLFMNILCQKIEKSVVFLGFSVADHTTTCSQCSIAKSVEELCPQGLDFVNQDQRS